VRAVLDLLEARSIPWYLTGSEALAAYGSPRQTLDTDIVVATTPAVLTAIAAAIEPSWLFAEPIRTGGRQMASLISRQRLDKIDLIIRDPDPWGEEALRRRGRWTHPVWGPVWISSLEDLILAKLEWSEGSSELQLRDCGTLLRLNAGRTDDAYLDRWARTLGVAALLDAVRRAP
jgi:hypothetical protein